MDYLLENIINGRSLLLEGRKEDAREKYPDIPEEIFDGFVEGDPSGNHKYLMWLCKTWESDLGRWKGSRWASHRYSDRNTLNRVMKSIQYFYNNPQKYEKKDINQYKSLNELINETVDAKVKLTRRDLKGQSKKIYEDDRHLVIQPLSHASSCYYGAGTRWCTASKTSPGAFEGYTMRGTLFYYINKRTGKKRAFQTNFDSPFLTPYTISGTQHQGLGSTNVFTETDSYGRSLRGIPSQAREAMRDAHNESVKKYVETLTDNGKKLEILLSAGLDLPDNITTLPEFIISNIEVIPNQITKIEGNVDTSYLKSLNNVREIGGHLYARNLEDLGELTTIGGNFSTTRWRHSVYNTNLKSLGNLKHIGGNFKFNWFLNLSVDELSKLEQLGSLTIDKNRANNLISEPNTEGLDNIGNLELH